MSKEKIKSIDNKISEVETRSFIIHNTLFTVYAEGPQEGEMVSKRGLTEQELSDLDRLPKRVVYKGKTTYLPTKTQVKQNPEKYFFETYKGGILMNTNGEEGEIIKKTHYER